MSERFDRIIYGGSVVLPGETRRADIGIRDGKIAAVREHLDPADAAEAVDASGLIVLAGMIDVHVHFNEPNLGHWEGFASGSAALAAGGATLYADMPLNGNPPTVSLAALEIKERLAAGSSVVDYSFWGGLMPGFLEQIEELAEAGVIGFKAFMSNPGGDGEGRFREVDRTTLAEGMKRIAAVGGILALHAEDERLTARLSSEALAAGRTDARSFAGSRPVEAELAAVTEALELADQTGCRLHFVHISSPEAVDVIDAAKRRGQDVTLETCPHYLVLTTEDMELLGPIAKCAPPLRDEERREQLWKRVAEGKIDFIASDHSPCPFNMKQPAGGSYFEAWGGIAGAQSSLELMFEEGYIQRGIPLDQLSALLSAHPAERFGFAGKGRIAEGYDADLVLLDPARNYTLTSEQLLQRHKHSPYVGRTFSGKVASVYCRGNVVYREDGGVGEQKAGVWVKPEHEKGVVLQNEAGGLFSVGNEPLTGKMFALLEKLAGYGAGGPGKGITRLLYSPEWQEAQQFLAEQMRQAGLEVRFDRVGNLYGRLKGSDPAKPVILTGSHVDTVRQGGKYDGAFGIAASLAAVGLLKERYGEPEQTLEVVSFCEEEGSRFPLAYWGSGNVTGERSLEHYGTVKDSEGISLEEAMLQAGFGRQEQEMPLRRDLGAYIELHIEQGITLEREGVDIGIVETIAGQRRYTATVTGEANHAGTTPMLMRSDAFAGAAEMIVDLEKMALEEGPPLVATVGRVSLSPNTSNVIPGQASFSLDIRHESREKLEAFCGRMSRAFAGKAAARGLRLELQLQFETAPAPMDAGLGGRLERLCAGRGISCRRMVSGAGHDAQLLAAVCPAAMLFVPSRAGVSHSPEEYTAPAQLAKGAELLAALLHQLAYGEQEREEEGT